MSKFDFIPEFSQNENKTFAHKTGTIFISIFDEGFLWYINHLTSAKPYFSFIFTWLKEFKDFWENIEQIEKFLQERNLNLLSNNNKLQIQQQEWFSNKILFYLALNKN